MVKPSEILLLESLGPAALAYLLSVDDEDLQARLTHAEARGLSDDREAVLVILTAHDAAFRSQNNADVAARWVELLAQNLDPQFDVTMGVHFRLVTGGDVVEIAPGAADLESVLARMAVQYYPIFLVRRPTDPIDRRRSPDLGAVHFNPLNDQFQDFVMADPALRLIFTEEDGGSGRNGGLFHGVEWGNVQLWTLAESLLSTGWSIARLKQTLPAAHEFVDGVLSSLGLMRGAISGETMVPSRIGFAGVHLPVGLDIIDLGWGTIRRADARDDGWAEQTNIRGTISGASAPGNPALVVSFSGDLVLEMDVPFVVILGDHEAGTPWPAKTRRTNLLIDSRIESVRLALVAAIPDTTVVIYPTWRMVLDPFKHRQYPSSWHDVMRAVGIVPFQLTLEEAAAWADWTGIIDRKRTPAIAVAIRRMLAVVSERRSAEDVLLDAVIVWENLYGSRTSITQRITGSLAWSLATSPEDQTIQQRLYKKIYDYRSRVVHGSPHIDSDDLHNAAAEAAKISIKALRVLFTTHDDLLAFASSEERSAEVLRRGQIR